MDITVLDSDFEPINILDSYNSLIWTDRFDEAGDFELYLPFEPNVLDKIHINDYIEIPMSIHTMVVDSISIDSDIESGDYITISGKSLESLLDRRIIWGLKIVRGTVDSCIENLIDESIISPKNVNRKIENFKYIKSSDPYLSGDVQLNTQYTGDNLYDVICSICIECGIGFNLINNNGILEFSLVTSTDRSYDQSSNPYVIFSPEFDNLLSSNYLESDANTKNIGLVGGEDWGNDRKYAVVNTEELEPKGLDRKELFIDARDISSYINYDTQMPEYEYYNLLLNRGIETMVDYSDVTSFEGDIEPNVMFVYGRDYFCGDIVQIENEYNCKARVQITETVINYSQKGLSIYPTFQIL